MFLYLDWRVKYANANVKGKKKNRNMGEGKST